MTLRIGRASPSWETRSKSSCRTRERTLKANKEHCCTPWSPTHAFGQIYTNSVAAWTPISHWLTTPNDENNDILLRRISVVITIHKTCSLGSPVGFILRLVSYPTKPSFTLLQLNLRFSLLVILFLWQFWSSKLLEVKKYTLHTLTHPIFCHSFVVENETGS